MHTFDEYQVRQVESVIEQGDEFPQQELNVMGLTCEANEVVDLFLKNHLYKSPISLYDLEQELGDVLWYLSAIATENNLSLENIARKNIEKLEDRYRDDKIGTISFDSSRSRTHYGSSEPV